MNFLTDWQRHSATLAAARQAKHKPPVWSVVPIGILIYIVGSIAAALCLIPVLALWAGLGGGMEEMIATIMSNQLGLTLAMNIPIMAVFIGYMRWIEKRSLLSMGFSRGATPGRYLAGLGLGALMMLAAVGIACAFGGMRFAGFAQEIRWGLWLLMLGGFLFQGMSEEVMCRGFLMVSAANRAPLWVGVALNSVIFAALHLFNTGVTALSFVNLILYGLFASFYFLRTDNIWGIGALHSSWNFVQGCVLGIGVSGNPLPVTTAYFVPAEGSAQALNGGLFGLEGSLASTAVLVAGILLLVLLPYNKNGRRSVQTEPATVSVKGAASNGGRPNGVKNHGLFQLIGWLIVALSLAGMAASLYSVYSFVPSLIAFAATCAIGICIIAGNRNRRRGNDPAQHPQAGETSVRKEEGPEETREADHPVTDGKADASHRTPAGVTPESAGNTEQTEKEKTP